MRGGWGLVGGGGRSGSGMVREGRHHLAEVEFFWQQAKHTKLCSGIDLHMGTYALYVFLYVSESAL